MTKGTVFIGNKVLIPMEDVSFIYYEDKDKTTAVIVTKNTQWSDYRIHGYDYWLNPAILIDEELRNFEKAFIEYKNKEKEQ